MPCNPRGLQKRLDRFRDWYNDVRPHQALGDRTPEKAWRSRRRPEPMAYRARDCVEPVILIRRERHRGDPDLPLIEIAVRHRIAPTACGESRRTA